MKYPFTVWIKTEEGIVPGPAAIINLNMFELSHTIHKLMILIA